MVHFLTIPVSLNGQQSTVNSILFVAFSFQNNAFFFFFLIAISIRVSNWHILSLFSGKSVSLGIKMKVFENALVVAITVVVWFSLLPFTSNMCCFFVIYHISCGTELYCVI